MVMGIGGEDQRVEEGMIINTKNHEVILYNLCK